MQDIWRDTAGDVYSLIKALANDTPSDLTILDTPPIIRHQQKQLHSFFTPTPTKGDETTPPTDNNGTADSNTRKRLAFDEKKSRTMKNAVDLLEQGTCC
jgi:hypothetical protein